MNFVLGFVVLVILVAAQEGAITSKMCIRDRIYSALGFEKKDWLMYAVLVPYTLLVMTSNYQVMRLSLIHISHQPPWPAQWGQWAVRCCS